MFEGSVNVVETELPCFAGAKRKQQTERERKQWSKVEKTRFEGTTAWGEWILIEREREREREREIGTFSKVIPLTTYLFSNFAI